MDESSVAIYKILVALVAEDNDDNDVYIDYKDDTNHGDVVGVVVSVP